MSRPRQNGGVQALPAAADPFAALVDVFAERVAGEILKRLEPLLQQVAQISINDSSVPRRGKGFAADIDTHTEGPIARSDPADDKAGERDKPRNRQVQILRPVAAAKKLGVSKMTVYRLENAGMILALRSAPSASGGMKRVSTTTCEIARQHAATTGSDQAPGGMTAPESRRQAAHERSCFDRQRCSNDRQASDFLQDAWR